MPLTPLEFRPGINKEVTRYANTGGWVDSDKVRFRRGFPEKIGGWQSLSTNRFLGTCRAIMEWATLAGVQLLGLGTEIKYYVVKDGVYYDITPLSSTTAPGDVTFAATDGSTVLQVNDVGSGVSVGDYVTFSGAATLGGAVTATVLNAEYAVASVVTADIYTVTLAAPATAADVGTGGTGVVAEYQLPVGSAVDLPTSGWGSGGWGYDAWGEGAAGTAVARRWNHVNYGEDLIYGPRGGPLYYWDYSSGLTARGALITGNDAPLIHTALLISDASRFVIALGCNELGDTQLDPMLVRWSDQEQYGFWTPAVTNQAGSYRLSKGSRIVTGRQSTQQILVWTDTALYSMQFIGAPYVWGFQILGDEISLAGPAVVVGTPVATFWMGVDKFYRYDGRITPLACDLWKFVFKDINLAQADQFFGGTVEAFNEVWWFYASAESATIDRYVVYNYVDGLWYHGTLNRTAWMDSNHLSKPLAAVGGTIVVHETGVDDLTDLTPIPIEAYVESSPVGIGGGDRASFVWRVVPDMTFEGSQALAPSATMELRPFTSSGAGYKTPGSVAAAAAGDVVRSAIVPVEAFTEELPIRVRGRQIALRVSSTDLGVAWQLGTPRVNMRPDGRRG
jgi:hypothetical protein